VEACQMPANAATAPRSGPYRKLSREWNCRSPILVRAPERPANPGLPHLNPMSFLGRLGECFGRSTAIGVVLAARPTSQARYQVG
jgi:hypothetical protein